MTSRAATLRRCVTGALLALIAAAPPVHGAGVALVTDLQGNATAASGGRTLDLTILTELAPDTQVQLAAGARLVALYLDAGEEYVFKGPANVVFRATQPDVVSGAKPEKRGPPLGPRGKDVRIQPIGIAQGALVMRGGGVASGRVQLLDPRRTRTLEIRPEFRWQALEPGVRYVFRLTDDTGRTLFQDQVATTSLRLPASVRLKEDVPYTWEVSARLPDGRKYSGSAEFAVAPAPLRAQATALRPADSALLSQRIAYAAWLEQMGLREEARKYWQAASTERPEDLRLRALSAN